MSTLRALDRYAAPNENAVPVAGPHSGPRRAERAKQILPTSHGRDSTGTGISRASAWLVLMLTVTVIAGLPVAAHHGRGATFDMKKQLTLKGTVSMVSGRIHMC